MDSLTAFVAIHHLQLRLQVLKRKPHLLGNKSMSITGYQPGSIKARLEAMKQKAAADRNGALAELDQAAAKHEEVTAEIRRIAAQEKKEAEDALHEFAQFTNGAPEDPQNGAAAAPQTNPPPVSLK